MKRVALKIAVFSISALVAHAGDVPAAEDITAKHHAGSTEVADKQDELSADAQQLAIEQTVPKVIELLGEVKSIMDEATDHLVEFNTGGETLAAQTEVIEKIHAAAKEKQKQQGGGKPGGAMMDMMERMMGKKPDSDKAGKGKNGNKPSDTGSNGLNGLSDAGNSGVDGQTSGKSEERRVPKAAGSAGHALPDEFKQALDAYNRGAEQKVK